MYDDIQEFAECLEDRINLIEVELKYHNATYKVNFEVNIGLYDRIRYPNWGKRK